MSEIPIVHVPFAEVLYERWEELGSFRAAFCSWGEQLLAGIDKIEAYKAEFGHSYDTGPDDGRHPKNRKDRHPLRDEAEQLLLDDNLSGRTTLAILIERHGDSDLLPSKGMLDMWRSRGRAGTPHTSQRWS